MRVLIINSRDNRGGAAKAAYRLHHGLLGQDVESSILVQYKFGQEPSIFGPDNLIRRTGVKFSSFMDQIPVKKYIKRRKGLFSPSWYPTSGWLLNMIRKINPDIVNLHWVTGGMVRIEDLKKIEKPIIWTMHDDWVFTGGCHLKNSCQKYKDSCGACPNLSSHKKDDLSRKVFLRKNRMFDCLGNNISFVGPSSWICACAKNSALLGNKQIYKIPNPIDTNLFIPYPKILARKKLGLDQNKKLVLFGGVFGTSDPNKGFSKLLKAINKIDNKNMELVVIGSRSHSQKSETSFNVNYMDFVQDEKKLNMLYSAADLTAVPSRQENLSYTIMESMACGTPAVAFDVGGNKELIDHKMNGYLSDRNDEGDFAAGMSWILDAEGEMLNIISANARKKIESEFRAEKITDEYLNFFKRK